MKIVTEVVPHSSLQREPVVPGSLWVDRTGIIYLLCTMRTLAGNGTVGYQCQSLSAIEYYGSPRLTPEEATSDLTPFYGSVTLAQTRG